MSAEVPNIVTDVRDVADGMAVAARTPGIHIELSEVSTSGFMRWIIEDLDAGEFIPVEFLPDAQLERISQ